MTNQLDSILTARHATLDDLADLLRAQHSAKRDIVTAASRLSAVGGCLRVAGAGAAVLSATGVTTADLSLRPTSNADADIAAKLDIPIKYLRRLRERHLGLYDTTVTELLRADDRRFLVRALIDQTPGTGSGSGSGGGGIVRALLGSTYRIVDNLDVLTAMLSGIRASGVDVQIEACDLSERRMYVKVRCEALAQYAPALLEGYTSPFTGARGADNPVVFPGFVVTNSETGDSSFSITPRLTVQVCDNGMTLTKDVMRELHRGSRLADGVVRWAADTQATALELVTKQTRDAVRRFLEPAFVTAKIAEIQAEAGVPITQPADTLEHVGTQLRYTAAERDAILGHFIAGGDATSGGVLHAVTSASQLITDPDAAYRLEASGPRAMSLAAAHAHKAA
jgi:hypothetical protein